MRFSASAIVAALPLLASAQQDPLGQYKAHFQTFMDKITSHIPNPGIHDAVAAAAAKIGAMKLSILTLENWKETLYEPVASGATVPVEWWVLITGRNKTCFGEFTAAFALHAFPGPHAGPARWSGMVGLACAHRGRGPRMLGR